MTSRPARFPRFAAPMLVLAALAQLAHAQAPKVDIGTKGFAHTKAFAAVPGPDAEYLLLADTFTLREDGACVWERRFRLQVNSYAAINRFYGETKVAYDPRVETFEVIHNRTVLPNGKIVEAPVNAIVDDQPPAAHGNPLWSHLRRKIIVHTALEPGAVIEGAYRVVTSQAAAPWLEVATPMALEVPIRERVVELRTPAKGVSQSSGVTGFALTGEGMSWIKPAFEAQGKLAVSIWHRNNVAAIPEDIGAPARDETLPMLWLSTCHSLDDAAAELGKRVAAAGAAPEAAVAAARTLADKETDPELRLLASLEAVTAAINVTGLPPSLQHWRPAPLAEVWRSGFATPFEAAILEARVLAALGHDARPVLLAGAGRNVNGQPGFAGFERALVQVKGPDDAWRLYDPANPAKGGPIEAALASPMLIPGRADQDAAAPAPLAPWRRSLNVQASVAADGTLAGTLAAEQTEGATQHAALLREAQRVTGELARLLPDGKAKDAKVTGLARRRCALSAGLDAKLPDKDAVGLVRLEIGGVPGGVERDLPAVAAAARLAPVALPGPGVELVEMELKLPKGWTVAALPASLQVKNAAGSVEIRSSFANGEVKIVRRIELMTRVVQASEAAAVRDLCITWLNRAGRELLLRSAS